MHSKLIFCLIITILILNSFNSNCQSELDQNIIGNPKYTVEEDAPEHARDLSFGAGIVFEPNALKNYADFFGETNFNIFNRLNIFGIYSVTQNGIISKTPITEGGQNVSTAAVQPGTRNWEAAATYLFDKKYSQGKEKMFVKKEFGRDYYTYIKTKVMALSGIRVGYQRFGSAFSTQDFAITGYDIQDPTKSKQVFSSSAYGSNIQENILFLGLSKSRIQNIDVNYDDYGEAKSSGRFTWYIDAMFAPTIAYSNMLVLVGDSVDPNYNHILKYKTYNINDYTNKFPMGGRIGVEITSLSTWALNAGAELGIRPGLGLAEGLYFQMKLGFGLNVRVF
jgi:hypothetical protein